MANDFNWTTYNVRRKVEGTHSTVFVVHDSSENAVGTITVALTPGVDTAEIGGFYVNARQQRTGIGGALWRAAEELLIGEGVRVAFLHVATTGVDAIRFYERRGFATAWTERWTEHSWTTTRPEVAYLKMFREFGLDG